MRNPLFVVCSALFSVTLVPSISQAQLPGGSDHRGMVASATEAVTLKPERLRLTMWIKAKASDSKAAVIALTEHKERVSKELVALKADKDSIQFSPTRVGAGGEGDEQQRMIQMYSRAMRNQAGGEAPKMPVVVEAKCAVRAEWPLPIREGDALALLPATLAEQIEARDLAGNNSKAALSEEEQESMEEIDAMVEESYSYSESSASGPDIKFLASISEEAVQNATATAYKKAVERANKMSSAMGIKLGKLVSVNASASHSDRAQMAQLFESPYGNPSSFPAALQDDREKVISAAYPDELSLSAGVSVTYEIVDGQP